MAKIRQQSFVQTYHCDSWTAWASLSRSDSWLAFAGLVVVADFRFWGGGGGGFAAGFRTGEDRKADGDGIVMVSIVRDSCGETSMMLWMVEVS